MDAKGIFRPTHDWLLIRPDEGNSVEWNGGRARVVGVGLGGAALVDPTRESGSVGTGVVVSSGPDADPSYQDSRVVFEYHSLTRIEVAGEKVALLTPSFVICLIDRQWSGDPLALEAVPYAVAPPGYLLIERAEMPTVVSRILLPDTAVLNFRAAEAEVMSIGTDNSLGVRAHQHATSYPFAEDGDVPGSRVYISGSVGRSVPFGLRGERRLYRCTEREIAGIIVAPTKKLVRAESQHHMAYHRDYVAPIDEQWDEGDPRGPQ